LHDREAWPPGGSRRLARAMPALACVLGLGAACPGNRGDRPAAGLERGDCRPDQSCEVGLLCLSNLCVRPPPGDCGGVAEQLASIDLGNYAEPATRAPVVARYRTACETARISRDEQQCLTRARDRWGAAQCAPRLFPEPPAAAGECAAIVARMRDALVKQAAYAGDATMRTWFDRTLVVLRESCEQDGWPATVVQCALTADGTGSLGSACSREMPPALQQRLQERMTRAMQDAVPKPP
jgi:hypothetical protein